MGAGSSSSKKSLCAANSRQIRASSVTAWSLMPDYSGVSMCSPGGVATGTLP
jgi:hypothetical protein